MDQHIDPPTAPIDLEEIMDAVTAAGTHAVVPREGKPPIIVMSVAEYDRLVPPPPWLENSWATAEANGLDKMTMDEIDEEIAAYRREQAEAAALNR